MGIDPKPNRHRAAAAMAAAWLLIPVFAAAASARTHVIVSVDISGSMAGNRFVDAGAIERARGYIEEMLYGPGPAVVGGDRLVLSAFDGFPLLQGDSVYSAFQFGTSLRAFVHREPPPARDAFRAWFPPSFQDSLTDLPGALEAVCEQLRRPGETTYWVLFSDEKIDIGAEAVTGLERIQRLANQYSWSPVYSIRLEKINPRTQEREPAYLQVRRIEDFPEGEAPADPLAPPEPASIDATGEPSPVPAAPDAFPIGVIDPPPGRGLVTVDPQMTRYPRGTQVTLTAEPAEGYRFAGWSSEALGDPDGNPLTFAVERPVQIEPMFAAATDGPYNVAVVLLIITVLVAVAMVFRPREAVFKLVFEQYGKRVSREFILERGDVLELSAADDDFCAEWPEVNAPAYFIRNPWTQPVLYKRTGEEETRALGRLADISPVSIERANGEKIDLHYERAAGVKDRDEWEV